ncbi:MAG: PorT family protein [Ferruginibacter sp.]|nr:PorT family protein [Ferruginibacter sp.]
MKKSILAAVMAMCSIAAYAQVSFGGQVGVNLGLGNAKDGYFAGSIYAGPELANEPKIGLLAGVVAEVDFGKLSFRPELNFIQKGSKSGISGYDENKFSLSYLELPLNVVYKLELGSKGNKVFFGLGPAIAFGLGGKIKNTDGSTGAVYSRKVKFDGKKNGTDDKAHFKALDLGANILGGFQMKSGLFARVAFTYGFSNLYPEKTYNVSGTTYDQSYKNRGVNLSVGYMLGGTKKK